MNEIEKQVDELGRVVLPIKFREKLGIDNKSKVIVSLNNNSISITPSELSCIICGGCHNLNKNFRLCADCIKKIRESD